jgi:hypothetical protein
VILRVSSAAFCPHVIAPPDAAHRVPRGPVRERTAPSPLLVADFSSVTAQGQTIPGGPREIITGSPAYLNMKLLAEETGLAKTQVRSTFQVTAINQRSW